MIKLHIFDLDGTLAPSKSVIELGMVKLVARLLAVAKVAVISGAGIDQYLTQFVPRLELNDELRQNLYLLPASGSSLYEYNEGWQNVYNNNLTAEDKTKIKAALAEVIVEPAGELFGEAIEDRGSQMTYSALGQAAPLDLKSDYDSDREIRKKMRARLLELLPEFEIGIGGMTSIDISKKGFNKAFGIKKILERLGLEPAEAVFVGDAMFPGGNDYSAYEAGVKCYPVTDPAMTAELIKKFIANIEPTK
ncbi:MAG: hypothetical protein A2589_01675 [Candidatus Vogelbacteria bacterium RIFOXYD1_FULL_46_19]|uniref:phosphomannomutase n=1 Tax=Candidatus Vogelbacteria bacterium RIFOXYD1_FULL_46_19 TaxID=1802439 RepID=A0A1G2QHP9_9BACT|nr:MAG: hypothetical protein A2589_01675 [Candidatus Vogelbacteria bacterium RIFOXYD1_FULL_46_19]